MQRVFQYFGAKAKFLILIATALILGFCRDTSISDSSSVTPQITIEDLILCEPSNNGWIPVSEFEDNRQQYFCAQMSSDVSPVRLTLLIQMKGNVYSVEYSDADEFIEGLIFFKVEPSLSQGQYTARILYARQTLGEINFTVTK